jgi:hypothetical protein
MTATQDERLYLVPQRFWAVTRNMNQQQAETLLEKVMELAAKHDVEALRQYDFVIIDHNRRNIA